MTTKPAPKATPKVTVIIPAKIRNEQEFMWLVEAIRSVPNKYPIVLVNDHSPLKWKVDNITVKDLPEGKTGLAAARNFAMSFVKTKFFFPLDADDWLEPKAIETALKAYPGDGFVYGSTQLEGKVSTIYTAKDFDICKLLDAVYWPNGCLQLTSNWKKIKWDETLTVYEDWDYWLRSVKAGIVGHPIPDLLYHYRDNPNGIINSLKANPEMALRARAIIEQRHSSMFLGEDEMCKGCGSKAKTLHPRVVSSPVRTNVIPPQAVEGMTLLTYIGTAPAPLSFYGSVSGVRYRFGGSTKFGQVANADVEGLLKTGLFKR